MLGLLKNKFRKREIYIDIAVDSYYNKRAVSVKSRYSLKEAEYPLSPAAVVQTGFIF